jgi:hypothetical protein
MFVSGKGECVCETIGAPSMLGLLISSTQDQVSSTQSPSATPTSAPAQSLNTILVLTIYRWY